MQATNIGWTDFSSSPVKYRDKNTGKVVWACVKASPGCVNCYAESLALRWGKGKPFTASNIDGVEPFLDTDELKTLLTSQKITGKRVFIEDMSDLFGPWVPDEMIDQVFAVMGVRDDVTFQVLTKRADRMADYLTANAAEYRIDEAACDKRDTPGLHLSSEDWIRCGRGGLVELPLDNALIGFSAENQEWFDKRAVQVAPLVRAGWQVWTSFEPLLGPIDPTRVKVPVPPKTITVSTVAPWMKDWCEKNGLPTTQEVQNGMQPVHGHVCELNALTGEVVTESGIGFSGSKHLAWAVVGGESGRGHRACEVEWIADLAEAFKAAKVPIFVKQDSGQYPGKQGRIPMPIWEMKQHPGKAVLA